MRLFYDQKEHREMIFKMYQEIFEDPKPFAQYYFDEVYKMVLNNEIVDGKTSLGVLLCKDIIN